VLEPRPGLVLRYDFLWKDERAAGQLHGRKDRPCAIVVVAGEKPDGSRDVVLCPVTHSPPGPGETAVPVPLAVARHLGLDDAPCWIKTDQVNVLHWEKGLIPHGVMPARKDAWAYGMIPQALGKQVFDQLREKARAGRLASVRRE